MKKIQLLVWFVGLIYFAGYSQIDLESDLTVFYTFDSNIGAPFEQDQSSNNNNGLIFGNSVVNGVLRIRDNDTDYFVPPSNVINGSNDFTLAYEVLFRGFHITEEDGNPVTNTITSGYSSLGNNEILTEYIKRRIWDDQSWVNVVSINLDDVYYTFENIPLVQDFWYHFTFVRENDTLSFYLNGEKVLGSHTVSPNNPIDVPSGNFIIGQEQDSAGGNFDKDQSLNGELDNFYCYRRALSPAEIEHLYLGGLIGDIDGDGFVYTEDCDDTNADIYPGALEILGNGIDEDCDGIDSPVLNTHEFDGEIIELFPNPVSDILNVVSSSGKLYKQSLYNEMGVLIFQTLSDVQLDCSGLESGIYILRVANQDGQHIFAERIVVSK